MDRRTFMLSSAAGLGYAGSALASDEGLPAFKSPQEAMKAPRERQLIVTALHGGTGVKAPDYLAVVDVDPTSKNYSRVVHRLPMTHLDDELHHFGWNMCASCQLQGGKRRYLVVPGLKSGRIYIVDASSPTQLKLHKVIEPLAIKTKTDLSAPHTVRCLPDGQVMISMLGTGAGAAPGGFLLLDADCNIAGRWDQPDSGLRYNSDFWYQPRQNVMLSTEWAAPRTFWPGYNPKDYTAGKYGNRIAVWDWSERKLLELLDVTGIGELPLAVRFLHNPASATAFVGAAFSSAVIRVHKTTAGWKAETVIQVQPQRVGEQLLPGLITDCLISMDDRFLYLSNWLHGDVRQYDISDPAKPVLTGQLFLGGYLGKGVEHRGGKVTGGPQSLQLSLDGKRLYVTNSLLSKWDDQFYPDLAKQGSWLMQVDCDTTRGGLRRNEQFFVDFGQEPNGPARARQIRYPGGDCTSEIFS